MFNARFKRLTNETRRIPANTLPKERFVFLKSYFATPPISIDQALEGAVLNCIGRSRSDKESVNYGLMNSVTSEARRSLFLSLSLSLSTLFTLVEKLIIKGLYAVNESPDPVRYSYVREHFNRGFQVSIPTFLLVELRVISTLSIRSSAADLSPE